MHTLRIGHDPLGQIISRVANLSGEYLAPYRTEHIREAIERRLQALNLPSFEAYLAYLDVEPLEACATLNEAFVGVTRFFRDAEAFEALAHQLARRFRQRSDPLRVYVAACSTGQEALSIFILLERLCQALALPRPEPLLATDINPHAINAAREGVYTTEQLRDLSASIRRQFFGPSPHGFYLLDHYQQRIHYQVSDVLQGLPPRRFDLICCRNLLIYLKPPAQLHLLQSLHDALHPEGLLFLGAYESAASLPALFALVDAKHSIYSRRH
ncbi:protein-glutamate O-methyltransferase CheR [Bradymonadaceae bacterium TMQ3]|uniref:Protein-glutamate O-methyltransferase CheR n=1 Tax=Lujinxingia sediminis TaxID=2480984 RepID=A0ABY0CRL5_9DELT|nr:protein-glutamate O-methyltransferase CheR [Lujinxingia sediminis]RDV37948.1 protein-glutamate O-methyltransferase CheR [Bradymonadaceae bacterium TMQ3]RVU42724.1 protein-glutamate O-methyltransferase CheR [Lujinxingia sediminis]TXC75274.1 protein-glutamate O-methyltransferase CheR [Bradymonadales bacterium TMQ1]